MYRIGIEVILGISLRDGSLHIDPCIPRNWPGFEVTFNPSGTPYHIAVENPDGVNRGVVRVEVDGVDRTGADVAIANDGQPHRVRVVLGAAR
jgi:cyclic beta-1,2-glucan synthetase